MFMENFKIADKFWTKESASSLPTMMEATDDEGGATTSLDN